MIDVELIISEFCIPMENDKVCDDLCGWDTDESDSSWCERNCGVTNSGTCPEMNCYKEWLKMKRKETYQRTRNI